MLEFVNPVGGWKTFKEPRPYVTTSGFAFDGTGRFPILWRGDKVRSARNCWSLPSGLHETGFTLAQQFANELDEECDLKALPETAIHVATYENIAPELKADPAGPQWHWVIQILALRVKTLDSFVNREPDKHTKFEFIRVIDLPSIGPWSPGLGEVLKANFSRIEQAKFELCGG